VSLSLEKKLATTLVTWVTMAMITAVLSYSAKEGLKSQQESGEVGRRCYDWMPITL
jgi:hypothetical protein